MFMSCLFSLCFSIVFPTRWFFFKQAMAQHHHQPGIAWRLGAPKPPCGRSWWRPWRAWPRWSRTKAFLGRKLAAWSVGTYNGGLLQNGSYDRQNMAVNEAWTFWRLNFKPTWDEFPWSIRKAAKKRITSCWQLQVLSRKYETEKQNHAIVKALCGLDQEYRDIRCWNSQ